MPSMNRQHLRGDDMAQLVGILFSLLLVSSRRMVVSVVEPISDLTFACRQRGLLWRRGGPDQWEFFTPGSKEPFKVERDTNEDGKADAVWEKGASASKSRR